MRIAHKFIGQLADMHQPVLMHADIHKRPKRRHVGHRAFQHHARLQIAYFLDPRRKGRGLETWPWVAPRFFQLQQNIAHRWQPKPRIGEIAGFQLPQHRRIGHHGPQIPPASRHDLARHIIRFRVHRTRIQRFFPIRYP